MNGEESYTLFNSSDIDTLINPHFFYIQDLKSYCLQSGTFACITAFSNPNQLILHFDIPKKTKASFRHSRINEKNVTFFTGLKTLHQIRKVTTLNKYSDH